MSDHSKYHGQFVWYDLMTEDTKAAAKFYGDVVGWDAKDSGMPGEAYTLLSKGSTMIGGLMPIPDEARASGEKGRWTGYVAVPDVDDYAERVKTAGGKIPRPPMDIPGIGRFAVAADPDGALFILFKGTGEPPPGEEAPADAPGRIGWRELQAGDVERAFAFYSSLFGWTKGDAMDMGPMGVYQIFEIGGVRMGGIMRKSPDAPSPFWLYYFNVEAIDAAMARANKAGAKAFLGPQEVPGGAWIANYADPQGVKFALVAPKR